MVQQLYKTVWQFPQKSELLFDPTIPLLVIYSKGLKSGSRRPLNKVMFIVALLTVAKRWEQTKCSSTDAQIKKIYK